MWYVSCLVAFIIVLECCSSNNSSVLVQTKELKGISIDLLVPGMMVNARVLSTLENGIMLSFLTYFTGTVCHIINTSQNITIMLYFCLSNDISLFTG